MNLDVTTREGYDIACALRGPDIPGSCTLKALTTGIIRHFAGMNPHATTNKSPVEFALYIGPDTGRLPIGLYNGAFVTSPRQADQILEKMGPRTRRHVALQWFQQGHFAEHFRRAARHLNQTAYWETLDTYFANERSAYLESLDRV